MQHSKVKFSITLSLECSFHLAPTMSIIARVQHMSVLLTRSCKYLSLTWTYKQQSNTICYWRCNQIMTSFTFTFTCNVGQKYNQFISCQTERQTDRETDRQRDRQTERQTHRETESRAGETFKVDNGVNLVNAAVESSFCDHLWCNLLSLNTNTHKLSLSLHTWNDSDKYLSTKCCHQSQRLYSDTCTFTHS